MTFIELPVFTSQVTSLVADEFYARLQIDLLRQPDKGDVIPNAGGLRKVRMKLPGRGKSGGARVIYLHIPKRATIILFYIYTKAERSDLSSSQLQRLRDAVNLIKQEYQK